jgi:hypothetical protein
VVRSGLKILSEEPDRDGEADQEQGYAEKLGLWRHDASFRLVG